MFVIYGADTYECFKAAKSDCDIVLYDAEDNVIQRISNIIGDEWNYIRIADGEWQDLEPEPTPEEVLQNKIDQIQADLDYCLMLLDEN